MLWSWWVQYDKSSTPYRSTYVLTTLEKESYEVTYAYYAFTKNPNVVNIWAMIFRVILCYIVPCRVRLYQGRPTCCVGKPPHRPPTQCSFASPMVSGVYVALEALLCSWQSPQVCWPVRMTWMTGNVKCAFYNENQRHNAFRSSQRGPKFLSMHQHTVQSFLTCSELNRTQ